MSSEVYQHIKETIMYTNSSGKLTHAITVDMFEETDIQSVELIPGSVFLVNIRGIVGNLPSSFFDKNSQEVLLSIHKRRNSPLWKMLYD